MLFFLRYAKEFESALNLICFLLCNLSVFIMSLFFFLTVFDFFFSVQNGLPA